MWGGFVVDAEVCNYDLKGFTSADQLFGSHVTLYMYICKAALVCSFVFWTLTLLLMSDELPNLF